MLTVLLSWAYIFIIALVIGVAAKKVASRFIPVPSDNLMGITGTVTAGLTLLTVYAEYFSVFYKISILCHVIVLVLFAVSFYAYKKDIISMVSSLKEKCSKGQLIVCAAIIVVASFYTSRGEFHTDTGIYHAQAIRILEEYGCIKGLGNFQLHFAYNSSYLALCALFTMSFILPFALHTMTGFFMVLYTCYAVSGLFRFREHKSHGGDMARLAIIIYAVTSLTGLQSPATDYGTMFFVLYILTAWISHAEEKTSDEEDISFYGFLSVLSIFAVSLKLSAAALVVVVALPFVLLLKKKMGKETVSFIIIGFLSFLPYLIRNVILSGWLFYPVESIDLFNVVWKIPAEYMWHDAAQIKVWGRAMGEMSDIDLATRLDYGISTWFPIWWDANRFYEKILVLLQVVGVGAVFINLVVRCIRKKVRSDVAIFYAAVFVNILMWFFTAPFIRYGLSFLLILPLCAAAHAADAILGEKKIGTVLLLLFAVFGFSFWGANYLKADARFVTAHAADAYYVVPEPFEQAETDEVDMNGVTVYNSAKEEVNSYYYCPSSCYNDMINRTELIGSTIKEGFKPKEVN